MRSVSSNALCGHAMPLAASRTTSLVNMSLVNMSLVNDRLRALGDCTASIGGTQSAKRRHHGHY